MITIINTIIQTLPFRWQQQKHPELSSPQGSSLKSAADDPEKVSYFKTCRKYVQERALYFKVCT